MTAVPRVGPNEYCTITVKADGFLTTTSFATKLNWDWLTVNGTPYSGSTGRCSSTGCGLSDQAVSSGATATWQSSATEQGWRLCYSTSRAPTTAPSTAPTRACSIHVSTNGTDSDTCGEANDSACKSIQKGIDRAGLSFTVCVHKGIYSCTGINIKQSIWLRGFDAVLDCKCAGGAFRICALSGESRICEAVEEVVVSGMSVCVAAEFTHRCLCCCRVSRPQCSW